MIFFYFVHSLLTVSFTYLPPQDTDSLKKTQGVGPIRKVVLAKEDHEGLGISITVSFKPLLEYVRRSVRVLWSKRTNLIQLIKVWFNVCILWIKTGWERARSSHPHLRNPPHPAGRALRRTACGRRHLSRQQHQPERCEAQRGRHHPLAAGEAHTHTLTYYSNRVSIPSSL